METAWTLSVALRPDSFLDALFAFVPRANPVTPVVGAGLSFASRTQDKLTESIFLGLLILADHLFLLEDDL